MRKNLRTAAGSLSLSYLDILFEKLKSNRERFYMFWDVLNVFSKTNRKNEIVRSLEVDDMMEYLIHTKCISKKWSLNWEREKKSLIYKDCLKKFS